MQTTTADLVDMLRRARSIDNQAVTLDALAKLLPAGERSMWILRIDGQVQLGNLPAGVGAMRIKGKVHVFLLEDVQSGRTVQAPVAPTSSISAAFDAAFDKLERQHGGYNFVNLLEVRLAYEMLGFTRAEVDAHLCSVRQSRAYSLRAAEGRFGISQAEQEAGIREEGALLLFVTRNR